MTQSAEYLIAQHVSDLFRREPRNIGVFLRLHGEICARFFGETEPGQIDGRKTRVLPFPGVYAQWVRYWRRTLTRHPERAWEEIRETTKNHYRVIEGGSLDGIGEDSIDDVITYLYAALVSDGGIASAIGGPDEAEAAVKLSDAISIELKRMHLLEDGDGLHARFKHPIRRNIPVSGATARHLLSFVQRDSHAVIMEPIDLAVRRDRKRMEERAGWVSLVFHDIRKKENDAQAIALINASTDEEQEPSAKYALSLLRTDATIVNWQSQSDRESFLTARAQMANQP